MPEARLSRPLPRPLRSIVSPCQPGSKNGNSMAPRVCLITRAVADHPHSPQTNRNSRRGVFPFFLSGFEQSPVRSGHMFQQVPPPRLVVRAQEQDGLGTGTTPEHARSFQAQVDDTAHGTFDGAAPDRQLQGQELRIRHAALVLDEVVSLRADRLAIATPTDRPHGGNDLLHLAPQQQAALLGAPAAAGFRAPVVAQGRDLSQVLYGMIKVQQLMYLFRGQA